MADPQDFDFEGHGGVSAPPDALASMNEKLAEAIELKEVVDQMEEDLKAAKKQLNHINTSVIPDMMVELGIEEVVQNGWKVKVDDFVSGSLPKDCERKAKAIAWLEEHEAGDLIKTSVSINFSRSQHNEALDIASKLHEDGYAPNVDSSVHPQTLAAFARERLRSGEPIDTEVLGLYTGRVAKYRKVG